MEQNTAEACREKVQNQGMCQEHGLLPYLWHSLTQNSLWMLSRRILEWLRRFRIAAFLLRAATLIWSVLQAGTAVILSTLVLLIALPLLTSLMLGILLTTLLEARKCNRFLLEKTEGKTVYVLFLPQKNSAFFAANVRDLARDPSRTVILVSPYWISSRGLEGKGYFYCTLRRETESVYLIRRTYFFALRRRVLAKRKTAYLY